jgi:hypothetical protein
MTNAAQRLALLTLLLIPVSSCAEDLRKFYPTDNTAIIFLQKGEGSVDLGFVLAPKVQPPECEVTEAVGAAGKIPKAKFTFAWEGSPKQSEQASVLRGTIRVSDASVQPNDDYKGKLICFWKANANATTVLDFTVVDRGTTEANISPDRIDLVVDRENSAPVAVRIKNVGKSELRDIELSTLDLVDAASGHRVEAVSLASVAGPLAISRDVPVTLKLPTPVFAGTYTGNLDLYANGQYLKSIPLSLRSRGPQRLPVIGYIPRLPLILLVLIVLAGFWASSKADDWFTGGGLERTETTLSLRRSRTFILQMKDRIAKWESETQIGSSLGQTKARLIVDFATVEEDLARIGSLTKDVLIARVQYFAARIAFYETLWIFILAATEEWGTEKDKLKAVVASFDSVPLSGSIDDYRKALNGLLGGTTYLQPKDVTEQLNRVAGTQRRSGGLWSRLVARLGKPPSDLDLQRKITEMALIYKMLVWTVVFLTALQTFYLASVTFGTANDYIKLFLWSLGLTQFGTQVIARAHGPYA